MNSHNFFDFNFCVSKPFFPMDYDLQNRSWSLQNADQVPTSNPEQFSPSQFLLTNDKKATDKNHQARVHTPYFLKKTPSPPNLKLLDSSLGKLTDTDYCNLNQSPSSFFKIQSIKVKDSRNATSQPFISSELCSLKLKNGADIFKRMYEQEVE